MKLFTKDEYIKNESLFLNKWATFSYESERISEERDSDLLRTDFQRDRDRIIHSRAFKRMMHKTQVYSFVEFRNDHTRTRLLHSIEVMQLATTVGRSLGLNNDLIEAIALGHDVGHTPFGHSGEYILHRISKGKEDIKELPEDIIDYWGFKHNHQSLRIFDKIEKRNGFDDMNLTNQTREGILKHTEINYSKNRFKDYNEVLYRDLDYSALFLDKVPFLEAQVVYICDEIAQQTHDLEDGLRLKDKKEVLEILSELRREINFIDNIYKQYKEKLENMEYYQERYFIAKKIIDVLIRDLIENSVKNLSFYYKKNKSKKRPDRFLITFSEAIEKDFLKFKEKIYRHFINIDEIKKMDKKAKEIIIFLFRYYLINPWELPDYTSHKFKYSKIRENIKILSDESKEEIKRKIYSKEFFRELIDYIAGMTDFYAIDLYNKLKTKNGVLL